MGPGKLPLNRERTFNGGLQMGAPAMQGVAEAAAVVIPDNLTVAADDKDCRGGPDEPLDRLLGAVAGRPGYLAVSHESLRFIGVGRCQPDKLHSARVVFFVDLNQVWRRLAADRSQVVKNVHDDDQPRELV